MYDQHLWSCHLPPDWMDGGKCTTPDFTHRNVQKCPKSAVCDSISFDNKY